MKASPGIAFLHAGSESSDKERGKLFPNPERRTRSGRRRDCSRVIPRGLAGRRWPSPPRSHHFLISRVETSSSRAVAADAGRAPSFAEDAAPLRAAAATGCHTGNAPARGPINTPAAAPRPLVNGRSSQGHPVSAALGGEPAECRYLSAAGPGVTGWMLKLSGRPIGGGQTACCRPLSREAAAEGGVAARWGTTTRRPGHGRNASRRPSGKYVARRSDTPPLTAARGLSLLLARRRVFIVLGLLVRLSR